MKSPGVWCVDITEHESGWGSRLEETIIFGPGDKAEAEAKKYSTEYNKTYNSEPTVPSWYMKTGAPYLADPAPTGPKVSHHKNS